jgi:hypothetical protein
MTTFPSIRQNIRLIGGGLWHTPADTRSTVVQTEPKCSNDGLFEPRNTSSDECLKLFLGAILGASGAGPQPERMSFWLLACRWRGVIHRNRKLLRARSVYRKIRPGWSA